MTLCAKEMNAAEASLIHSLDVLGTFLADDCVDSDSKAFIAGLRRGLTEALIVLRRTSN